jgi:hypothetical protein
MKELTKEQKLEVLEICIRDYGVYPGYLCCLITRSAYSIKMISHDDYCNYSNSIIATILIPELLTFKPEGRKIGDAWFCDYERRKEVLDELYKLIKNNHE